jgi:hypothetical protein
VYVNALGIVPHAFSIATIARFHLAASVKCLSPLAMLAGAVSSLLANCAFDRSGALAQRSLPYRDPKLNFEERVSDLLSRMTLEVKVAPPATLAAEPAVSS